MTVLVDILKIRRRFILSATDARVAPVPEVPATGVREIGLAGRYARRKQAIEPGVSSVSPPLPKQTVCLAPASGFSPFVRSTLFALRYAKAAERSVVDIFGVGGCAGAGIETSPDSSTKLDRNIGGKPRSP